MKTRSVVAIVGVIWTAGFLLLGVAALFSLLPDPGEVIWGGVIGRVVEAIAAASWFMPPLLVAALLAGIGHQSKTGDPRVGIPSLVIAGLLLSPYPWRDPHGIAPVLIIAVTPWLAKPLVEYVENTSSSIPRHASWIVAAAVLLNAVGMFLSALRGVIGGVPGMRWEAMAAEVGYFTVSWGLALGAFTFVAALVTAIYVLVGGRRGQSI